MLGLVSVWLILLPDPGVAPEMLPVMAPIVHANVDVVDADNTMFVLPPLHICTVDGLVTAGVGLTVTTME